MAVADLVVGGELVIGVRPGSRHRIGEREQSRLRPCPQPGCHKTCPPGERTCFDHIDVSELERLIAEPDPEEEAASDAARNARHAELDGSIEIAAERAPAAAPQDRLIEGLRLAGASEGQIPEALASLGFGKREIKQMAKIDGDDLTCPSCGRKFGHGPASRKWHAAHVATCRGPQATVSPRAKPVSETSRASAKRPTTKKRDYKAERERRQRNAEGRGSSFSTKVEGPKQEPRLSAISPAAFLGALRAERAKIDAAIAAVEALA